MPRLQVSRVFCVYVCGARPTNFACEIQAKRRSRRVETPVKHTAAFRLVTYSNTRQRCAGALSISRQVCLPGDTFRCALAHPRAREALNTPQTDLYRRRRLKFFCLSVTGRRPAIFIADATARRRSACRPLVSARA